MTSRRFKMIAVSGASYRATAHRMANGDWYVELYGITRCESLKSVPGSPGRLERLLFHFVGRQGKLIEFTECGPEELCYERLPQNETTPRQLPLTG